jgi:hypothetical protein
VRVSKKTSAIGRPSTFSTRQKWAIPARAQEAPASPAPGDATYVVLLGGREVGREQVTVSKTPAGWRIASTGRLLPPLSLTNNGFEVTYAPDWQPIELKINAQVQDRQTTLATSFATTTAINEITLHGVTNPKKLALEKDGVRTHAIFRYLHVVATRQRLAGSHRAKHRDGLLPGGAGLQRPARTSLAPHPDHAWEAASLRAGKAPIRFTRHGCSRIHRYTRFSAASW